MAPFWNGLFGGATMMPWWWLIGGVWAVCAAIFILSEPRMATKTPDARILDSRQPWSSAIAYGILVIISPILMLFFVLYAIWIGGPIGLKWCFGRLFLGRTADPFSAPESEWPTDRDLFLGRLIRRRQLSDARMRRQDIDKWMIRQFWTTPDAAVLEAVDGCRDLKSAGVPDASTWARLDVFFGFTGDPLPVGTDIVGYLVSRLGAFDRGFVALGADSIAGHVDVCARWLNRRSSRGEGDWPPIGWLRKKTSQDESEALGRRSCLLPGGTPAVLFLGGDRMIRELAALKLRMLDNDEIWDFSSPPETWRTLTGRGGIALVRDGRVVAHVVTLMN